MGIKKMGKITKQKSTTEIVCLIFKHRYVKEDNFVVLKKLMICMHICGKSATIQLVSKHFEHSGSKDFNFNHNFKCLKFEFKQCLYYIRSVHFF